MCTPGKNGSFGREIIGPLMSVARSTNGQRKRSNRSIPTLNKSLMIEAGFDK